MLTRYRAIVFDSARWDGFEFRPGDIVISTPPKCGTTWTQMLVALIVFDGPDFPAPLDLVSPWLDMTNRPIEDVRRDLAAQRHRRFIKTHTPLDGVPFRDDVTYVVVGRDPRDVSVSMEHHLANLDRDGFLRHRAAAVGLDDLAEVPPPPPLPDDPAERFRLFVEADEYAGVPTLATVLHHLGTGWERRAEPNVALFHYSDYKADLPGEMCRLAQAFGIELSRERAEQLAPAARLDRMRERARQLAPGASHDNWHDVAAFFRSGGSGEWRDRVTDADLDAYERRVAELAPPDLAAWAHAGRLGSGIDPGARS